MTTVEDLEREPEVHKLDTGSALVAVSVPRPDEGQFKRSEEMLEQARAVELARPEDVQAAGEDLKLIKATHKELDRRRKAITGPLNKALREANGLFRPALNWLKEAESIIKRKMADYTIEQERIAREAQAMLEAEAEAERKRLEAEALQAIEADDYDKAEEVMEQLEAPPAPVPQVKPDTPKVEGVSQRVNWTAKVTDKLAFVKHVAEHPELLAFVEINQSALNNQAKTYKDKLSLPGVEAVKDIVIAARS